jgi:hypothetical protein
MFCWHFILNIDFHPMCCLHVWCIHKFNSHMLHLLPFLHLYNFSYKLMYKKSVQKDKRNQHWTELVRGYLASGKPLGLISSFAPIGMLDLGWKLTLTPSVKWALHRFKIL